MAKRKPIKNSSMMFVETLEDHAPQTINPNLSDDIKSLVEFCSNYKGKFAEPIKVNSYMIINDFDKFLNKQMIILQSWDETNIVARASITRLLLFKQYINNQQ